MKLAIQQMHHLSALDNRFCEALSKCEAQLAEVTATNVAPSGGASATQLVGPTSIPTVETPERAPAAQDTPHAPAPPTSPASNSRPGSPSVRLPRVSEWKFPKFSIPSAIPRFFEDARAWMADTRYDLRSWWRGASVRQQQATLAIVGFIGMAILGIILIVAFHPGPTQYVAEATVLATQSPIRKSPNGGVVATIGRGSRVRVSVPSPDANREWVPVQFVTEGGSSVTGMLRSADLGAWSAKDPAVTWRLLKLYTPAGGASDFERQRYITELEAFAAAAPAAPQSAEATHQAGELRLALVQGQPCGEHPPSCWVPL